MLIFEVMRLLKTLETGAYPFADECTVHIFEFGILLRERMFCMRVVQTSIIWHLFKYFGDLAIYMNF